ncbi:MAG: hypothetical protein HKN33_09725 [Pyrinomonadaceae bacterium]|nr:hypothetical protein [Pyrinomonadaceae bacterium]
MPNTAISFGRLLILVGVIGYVVSMINARSSVTALIPAFFGITLLILGYFARMKEGLRKHLMHAAVLVAILGFIAVAVRLVTKISEITFSAAYVSQIVTALLFLAFIVLSVRSFLAARSEGS